MCGFGVVRPLPGIVDSLTINTAITLPIGVEAYAALALRAALSNATPTRARKFARVSSIGALVLGAVGQVAYHLMSAAGLHTAPWPVVVVVSVLPVAVLGMGAALAHLIGDEPRGAAQTAAAADVAEPLPVVEAVAVESSRAVLPVHVAAPAKDDAPAEPTPEPVETPTVATVTIVPEPAAPATVDPVLVCATEHPDWTQAQIASATGVSERTVRRRLAAARTTTVEDLEVAA